MTTPFKLMWLSSYGASGWDSSDFAIYDWRRPDVYGEMAKLLENRGGFEALLLEDQAFIAADSTSADVDIEFGGGSIVHDPTPLLSAVSWYTRHIGLIATAPTATWPPFMLARALGTLDHLSFGRTGWNVDTSFPSGLLENYQAEWGPEDRFARSAEHIAVCKMLWDSWEADAVLLDRKAGRFADGSKVNEEGFNGKYFQVRGPMTFARPPQRYPVIASTDTSPEGLAFAAEHAEVIVIKSSSASDARELCASVRHQVRAAGRDVDHVKVFWAVRPFVSDSAGEARALRARLMSSPAGIATAVEERESFAIEGDPSFVAGQLADLVDETAVDGIAIQGTVTPTNVLGMTDRVIPILRAAGLVRTGYRHEGFRDNLLDPDFVGIPSDLVGGVK